MPLPTVSVTGRVGSDPVLNYLPDGKPVLNFSVVADKKRKTDDGQWVDDKVCWMNAAVFGHPAAHAAETLMKGMEVVISGAIATRTYDRNDGTKGTSVDLTVYSIGPSLQWDQFAKIETGQARPQPQQQAAPQQQNPWQQAPQQQAPPPQQQNPWAQPQGQPQAQPQQAWGNNQGEPPF